jgi:hypothetical protein
MLGEAHALSGQTIDIRGPDGLLAVAAHIAKAKVVGKDEDDVRFPGCRFSSALPGGGSYGQAGGAGLEEAAAGY